MQKAARPDRCPGVQRTLELTDAQVRDLLQLRRLWLTKVAHLSCLREQILQQMSSSSDDMQHPGRMLARMSQWTTALKENAAESYRVYNRTVCALLRGVRKQGWSGARWLCLASTCAQLSQCHAFREEDMIPSLL